MSLPARPRLATRWRQAGTLGICLATFLLGCKSEADDVAGMSLDLATVRPLEVLDIMKKHTGPHSIVSVDEISKGWVKEEDLPALIALIPSTEKCAPIKMSVSSLWPPPSTVGEQAAIMVESFQVGKYPPRLNSGPVSEERKQALLQWWRDRSK